MPGKNSPLEKARAWVATGTERALRRAERASILAGVVLVEGDGERSSATEKSSTRRSIGRLKTVPQSRYDEAAVLFG